MEKVQTCPICGKEQIPADRPQCPQCNADLRCFHILDAIPEEKKGSKQGWRQGALWVGIFLFLIFLGGWLGHVNTTIKQHMVRLTELLTDNQKELKQYQQLQLQYRQRIDQYYHSLKSVLEGLESNLFFRSSWPDFFWYKTSHTDTLWDISVRFYRHGRYYPVLMAMNPEIDIFEIKGGQQIKVLKDQGEVIRIYNQFVIRKGKVLYFWYQVREGDTPEGLSKKFYKTEDHYHFIQQMNKEIPFEPGQKIKILLDEDL